VLIEKKSPDDFRTIQLSEQVSISKDTFVVMAGPCAAETRDQVMRTADSLAAMGIKVFRAGCFKPRTDPYAFQGSGEEGLQWLSEVREQYGMKIISEVTNFTNFEIVNSYVDIIQIGAKAIYDHSLLINSGKAKKPVLVKRGFGTTVEEYLRMVEYILANGNDEIMLCERGIRTFESSTRFTLDLCGASIIQERARLPLILDPSHAVGIAKHVSKLALASTAFDCEGLIVEVHCDPETALCDKNQALTLSAFQELYHMVGEVTALFGRTLL
jgi:3-deoxy-7-phosphoheptulonate synthase